jgi:hypothetical protein
MKNLSDAPLKGRLLALPTNIRLGWQYLPGTNTLAYYEKSFIGLTPGLFQEDESSLFLKIRIQKRFHIFII